ncbi:MAG: anthranilate phosphoribosyltransferase, partial [Aggregatibacter aphrophilus]|nr:anthranilate phosphoribosyltransferase [Aggregatibacter aphrophilus]
MENQALLEKLYGAQTLTAAESEALFNAIMLGELTNEQISAMLVALRVRGETIDEVNGAVLAAVKNAKPFPTPDYPFADIVGTGGDGANTINISTASAIVAAACGAKVAATIADAVEILI